MECDYVGVCLRKSLANLVLQGDTYIYIHIYVCIYIYVYIKIYMCVCIYIYIQVLSSCLPNERHCIG